MCYRAGSSTVATPCSNTCTTICVWTAHLTETAAWPPTPATQTQTLRTSSLWPRNSRMVGGWGGCYGGGINNDTLMLTSLQCLRLGWWKGVLVRWSLVTPWVQDWYLWYWYLIHAILSHYGYTSQSTHEWYPVTSPSMGRCEMCERNAVPITLLAK